MKINNVYEILNEQFAVDTSDDSAVILAPDLSNIYDFGHKIIEGATISELESALKGVVTKISKVVWETSDFVDNSPSIMSDAADYIGTIETLRVSLDENMFDPNSTWDVVTSTNTNSFERMFGYAGAKIDARYSDKAQAFELKISKTAEQFRDAFKTAGDMIRYFSEIEKMVQNYIDWAIERLNFYCFVTGVLGVANDRGTKCIKAAGNTTADFINNIKSVIREFEAFTDKYKADKFVTATPKSKIKLAILGQYYDEMSTALADTRHPEFLKIPMSNVQDMNYMQSPVEPSKMTAKVANTPKGSDSTTLSNIVAVLYDERAMRTAIANKRVAVVNVENEEFKNYFYKFSGQYYNNLDYPIVIFTKNGYADLSNDSDDEE